MATTARRRTRHCFGLNFGVNTVELNDFVQMLVPAIKAHLGPGENTLLALPDQVMQVRRICSDNNADAHDVERVVVQDPAFAGYLLQLANSTLYGYGKDQCRRVIDAIRRLGVQRVGSLSLVYMSRQLHQSGQIEPRFIPLLQRNWLRSWEMVRGASDHYWRRRGNMPAHHFRVDISDVITAAVLFFTGSLAVITVVASDEEMASNLQGNELEAMALQLNHRIMMPLLQFWGIDKTYAQQLATLDVPNTGLSEIDFLRLTVLTQANLRRDILWLSDTHLEQWRNRFEILNIPISMPSTV